MSRKYLFLYVNESVGRHNARRQGTVAKMGLMAGNMEGRQLPYKRLVR